MATKRKRRTAPSSNQKPASRERRDELLAQPTLTVPELAEINGWPYQKALKFAKMESLGAVRLPVKAARLTIPTAAVRRFLEGPKA